MSLISSQLDLSNRDFLRVSSVTAGPMASVSVSHAQNKKARFRLRLAGCGCRETDAASEVLTVAPNVTLVAVGDGFREKVEAFVIGLKAKDTSTTECVAVAKRAGLRVIQPFSKSL
jgi:hypothetical protein